MVVGKGRPLVSGSFKTMYAANEAMLPEITLGPHNTMSAWKDLKKKKIYIYKKAHKRCVCVCVCKQIPVLVA